MQCTLNERDFRLTCYSVEAKHVASEQLNISKPFLSKVRKAFVDADCMVITGPGPRGRKPSAIYNGKSLDPEHVALLENWVMKMNEEKGGVTAKKLQCRFKADLNILVSKQMIRYVLTRLGYEWGSAKKVSRKVLKCKNREKQIHEYLIKYADALKRQESGEVVIVYMDETYCHQNHSSNYTWYNPKLGQSNIVRVGSGKGARFIIVHAISADGLLNVSGQERQELDTEDLTEQDSSKTAEWVFEGPRRKGDYHKNMNGDNFMKWVKHRLLPAFKAMYGENENPRGVAKKLALVLDNAPYHHVHDDDFTDVSAMNRQEVLSFLIVTAKMSEITIVRNGVEVKANVFVAAGQERASGKNSPKVDELKAAAKSFLITRPDLTRTKLKKLFSELGYELIFTPPYTPSLQPIELTWSNMKRYVSEEFAPGRTIPQTRQHIYEGFYGVPEDDEKNGYTPQTARNHIEHCHKSCNYFIQQDPLLKGTIDALEVVNAREGIQDANAEQEDPELTDNDTFFNGESEDSSDDKVDGSDSAA